MTTQITTLSPVLESDIKDQSFTNLLENGDFESWSGGTAVAPDGWTAHGAIVRSTTHKMGVYSSLLSLAGSLIWIHQDIPDYTRYRNRAVTLGCWVKTSVANQARIQIYDGVSDSFSDYHTGSGDWEFLTFTTTIANTADRIRCVFRAENTSGDAYFDGVIIVEGLVCPAFSPKPVPYIQSDHIADPAESIAGNNTAIDAILIALEKVGILASS